MVQLKPDNYIALYNLACADSLLNNVIDALKYLEKSVLAGYTNLEHMLNDSDLKNIRDTEGFKKIVELINNIKNGKNSNDSVQFSQTSDCNCENFSDSSFCCSNLNEDPVVLETNNLDSVVFEEVKKSTRKSKQESL